MVALIGFRGFGSLFARRWELDSWSQLFLFDSCALGIGSLLMI